MEGKRRSFFSNCFTNGFLLPMATESKQTERQELRLNRPGGPRRRLGRSHFPLKSKMSSPLSLLKKTKRSPLQGSLSDQWDKQKVPFRRNLQQEFQAALASDDPSDPAPHSSHTSANGTSTSKAKASLKKAPPSDFELMSAMMQRVTLLEKTVKSQAQDIEQKGKIISNLEEKLRTQEKSVKKDCRSDRDDLERRLQKLQNQVYEMENFLSDYGLVWVGDGQSSDSAESERTQSEDFRQPGASADRSFHMNFDLVLQRINELNVLTGESFVQTTVTGAKLAKKDPIPLRLYSNGILMFDGPFRSYQEPSTQQCMQDLMDGFFPTELQQRFPDGVPFEVHDRRHEEFIIRLPWDTFPGEGQAVCGKRDESSNVVTSQLIGKNQTTEQFLSNLPKVVVKAGRVIDIRDSLRKLHGSSDTQSSSSVILIDTPALHETMERKQTLNSDKPPPAKAIITLKVKSEDGNHTYMVKMFLSETVGHLRSYLDKQRGCGPPGYTIHTYPQCCFNDSQTLHSCGLSANTTLLLRKRQQSESQMEVNKPTEVYVGLANDFLPISIAGKSVPVSLAVKPAIT